MPQHKQLKRSDDREHDPETTTERAPDTGLLEMQRLAGNRAANAMVQAKMLVGPVDDPFEREADQIASRVVGHGGQEQSAGAARDPMAGGFAADNDLASYIGRGGGSPLDGGIRRKLEPGFGLDFSDVRVHNDGESARMAESIGASAFTFGNDVYFGKNAYEPGSQRGEHLLAHELTHVVQQTGHAQRKIARRFDGGQVPSRLAQRRIQGNFLKKAKEKAQQFFGRSKKDVREQTGEETLDQKSRPELQQYMARTKGGGPSENPDWSNPKFFGQEPNSWKVKLAVAQEDANWLKNTKALRNAGYKAAFSSEGRKALGSMDKEYLAKKALESQGGLDGLTDEEIKEKIAKFTDGIYDVGHTWIRLESYVNGELKDLYSYGMWPAKIAQLENNPDENYGGFAGPVSLGQGEIRHPDNMHEGDAMKMYYAHEAKKPQFDKALKLAGERYASPPPYVLVGYNCTAFAREIFQAAGGSYPSGGRLLPGFAYTPGNLYSAIAKKAEEDEKKKAKGGKGTGKATKDDAHKDIVEKVQDKQGKLSEAGKRDTAAETFAVPKSDAKTAVMTFYAPNFFRYGQRPDYATDNKLTLSANKQMTAIDNPEAEARWDVTTFWLGPKKYIYVPSDDVEDITVDPTAKKKKTASTSSSAMQIELYSGQGGGFKKPNDGDPVVGYASRDTVGFLRIDNQDGDWDNVINFRTGEFFWCRHGDLLWLQDPVANPRNVGTVPSTVPETKPEAPSTHVVSKDEVPLYNNKDDKTPYTSITTKQIDNDMLDFDPMGSGWLSLYIASWGGESYWVKESDYEEWKKLNGRKY